ncbi:hypothetical protein SAMN04488104_102440 [Algoriphagus faecimaris]|uniref:Uncharacterized protein n=1 Tax=Algoriphagus faecimaris TaxID=686796 RepID=A0A1G6TUR9_9BACT|nr:hypothetical protein [Algoriphagus faecimaris]SDD32779.1 hypothetical protein SAMN04488104_102440 [Algoriphagus faecimaris]
MEIQFNESELNTLARSFTKKNIKIKLLEDNSFQINALVFISARCHIERTSERSLCIRYNTPFLVNQLVKFFGNLEKTGIVWDKKNAKIHLDFIQLLREKNPAIPFDIGIESISIAGEKLNLNLALSSSSDFIQETEIGS